MNKIVFFNLETKFTLQYCLHDAIMPQKKYIKEIHLFKINKNSNLCGIASSIIHMSQILARNSAAARICKTSKKNNDNFLVK